MKISVTVITFNEEKNIRRCLELLAWADEIIVVDSGSTDKTIEIAKEFSNKVIHNKWPGHKEQKNFAISHASNEWILSIDADEEVSDALKEEIYFTLANPKADGYRFPRKNYVLGKWIKHGGWYPDKVLRLFKKSAGSFKGINPHDKVEIDSGKVEDLKNPVIHRAYTSISQYIAKQNFYSSISAKYIQERPSRFIIVSKVFSKFIEVYILKKGFLDGFYGLILAISAAYFCFAKYLKKWTMEEI